MKLRVPRRAAALALVATICACASSPERQAAPDRDRTEDPEFVQAREASQPEFETQADALAAGVYEPFVHPDSIAADRGASGGDRPGAVDRVPGADPTTEELLGTLDRPPTYNPLREADEAAETAPGDLSRADFSWTLQMGAFDTEAGALVRIRQLERQFPDLPLWTEAGGAPGGVPGDTLHRVFMGRFGDRQTAESARARIVGDHPDAWVTRAP